MFCCTAFWANHCNQAISANLWDLCICLQVFWPTPPEQSALAGSGKGFILKLQVSHFPPHMFNRIKIRAQGPLQNNPVFCSKSFLGVFSCVLCVIILLEDAWPAFEMKLSDTGMHIPIYKVLIVLRCHFYPDNWGHSVKMKQRNARKYFIV